MAYAEGDPSFQKKGRGKGRMKRTIKLLANYNNQNGQFHVFLSSYSRLKGEI